MLRSQEIPELSLGRWELGLLQCRLDVGLAEVLTLEKEALPRRFGEGVGKAVAKVEAGGMAAFAVIRISLAGQEGLLFRDRLNGNAGSAEKRIALKEALVTDAIFRDNRGFDKGCGGKSRRARRRDSID